MIKLRPFREWLLNFVLLAAFLALMLGGNPAQSADIFPERGTILKARGVLIERRNNIESALSIETPVRFEPVRFFPESGESRPTGLKGKIEEWLTRHPFFKRHPHPMVVHFPVALLLVTALFEVLALATSSPRIEWAAYCCLLLGTLSIPVAMMTGYFTWWINYAALEFPTIFLKRFLAWVALVLAVFAVLLRSYVIKEPLQRPFYLGLS